MAAPIEVESFEAPDAAIVFENENGANRIWMVHETARFLAWPLNNLQEESEPMDGIDSESTGLVMQTLQPYS